MGKILIMTLSSVFLLGLRSVPWGGEGIYKEEGINGEDLDQV